jgi:hypothetical protein
MIGIISDTHDNLEAIDKVVEFLNRKKVSLVIHAGDYVAPFVVPRLKKLNASLIGVFGNNDGERRGLSKRFSEVDVILDDFIEFERKKKRIAVYHGSVEPIVDALVKGKRYDIVVRGHTHEAEIRNENGVLVINPGEVCGYLSGKKTLCVLDMKKMKARIYEI